MSDILLVTANARYIHSAVGLRCLLANMGQLQSRTAIVEFSLYKNPVDMVERILEHDPAIVAFGVYIWNVELLTAAVSILRRIRPEVKVVLGGPEVSFVDDAPAIAGLADVVVGGEGEEAFPLICADMLEGRACPTRFVQATPIDLSTVRLPYGLYNDQDVANRVIYVEASRGCPYGCEFCLSCLDSQVRRFPPATIVTAIDSLWSRGVRRFKFVDRALHLADTAALLRHFLAKDENDLFLHFELVPDRLPEAVLELLARFPPGTVQLEAGVQTFTTQVAQRIGRRQDVTLLKHNLTRLLTETGVHVHSDLVAGLPGETPESLADSFNQLAALKPHEIQLGILKRLRGAPITRHDSDWGMIYNRSAPYEVLQTGTISFARMQSIKRFSRYLDIIVNSGSFRDTVAAWMSPLSFEPFMEFSDWLFEQTGQTSHLQLDRLAVLLFNYLAGCVRMEPAAVAASLQADWIRCGRGKLPKDLRGYAPEAKPSLAPDDTPLPSRQKKHR